MAKTPRYKTGPKKGQFKPRGRKSRKKGKRKTALTKYRRRPVAKKKKRRRRSRRGGLTKTQETCAAAAAYGYVMENTAAPASLPAMFGTGTKRDFAIGAAAWAINKYGMRNKWLSALSDAAFIVACAKLGQNNFTLSGGDIGWADAADADELAGHIGPEG